jgi:hypothetical protein
MIATSTTLPTVLGLAASIISVLLGLIYLAAILTSFIKAGLSFPPSEPVQFVGAVVSILSGIVLVILMAAIQWHIRADRQLIVEIALIFAALLCVTTGINRYVQLAVIPLYNSSENPDVLALIHPYGSKSIMFAIESLGWGVFYGLAVLFAGLAIVGTGMEAWIGWLFILGGGLSLLYAVGVVIRQPILSLLGFPAWGVLLPATSILLALRFWSLLRG